MPAVTNVEVLTAAVFLGALVASGSVALLLGGGDGTRERRARRLARVGAEPRKAITAELAATIRRRERQGGGRPMDRWLKRSLPRREALEARLARTGRKISLSKYVVICFTVLAFSSIVASLLGLPSVLALAVGTMSGVILPYWWVGLLAERRARRFVAQFPEAIDQIVRGVRSGLPVGEALAGIGRDLPAPVSTEFQSVVDNVKLGRTLEEALWQTARRLTIPEFNFLVISMVIQRETGGNLAETLENLSDIIRRRHQMKQKARAMASEARASALIVGSLPFILGGILFLVNPDYISKLFTDPRGVLLLAAALTSEGVGFMVMMKMANFKI